MEEVELICDRIIIIDKGKLIASGTADELKELSNIEEKVTVEMSEFDTSYIPKIQKLDNVDEVKYSNNILHVTYHSGKNNITEMMEYLRNNNIKYNKIYSERPTLNDVFLELTGKELRD